MSKIKILPDQIINLIAAGEVIERPASVVKELVENSLDSTAARITVETLGAGRDLIRVTDDGVGITRSDLKLAVKRHATSKLNSPDQLWQLHTLGFRGEALASISEVARVELVSRTAESDVGYALTVEGGKIIDLQPVGVSQGTQVTVEDLFFNTPARAKYLKNQSGENRQIIKIVQEIAIANPGVSFALVVEGQMRIKTPGNSEPLGAAAAVFGTEFSTKLREVNFHTGFGKVTGWLGEVGHYTSTRSQQILAVNGRVFQHAQFGYVVENAYKGLLPVRRFPVFFLDISVDAAAIDVNVHPGKQEVKFQYESEIRSLLYHAVKATLLETPGVPPQTNPSETSEVTPEVTTQAAHSQVVLEFSSNPKQNLAYTPSAEPVTEIAECCEPDGARFSYFGQINETYLVWEYQGELVLMDQHAAHERILFEEILAGLANGHLDQQELLFPQTLHLSAGEWEAVWEAREALERFGFSLEEFGANSLLLRRIPVIWAGFSEGGVSAATLTELAAALEEGPRDNKASSKEYFWRAAQVAACRGAIKAGERLTGIQARKLISDWLDLGIPTCPHGRPIVKRFNRTELEKFFLRS